MVIIKDGAIIMYHYSVKSGNGPFSGIQERKVTYLRLASARSSNTAVLKNVAMKIETVIAVISPVIVWYPTFLINMMHIVLMIVLTTVIATVTDSLIAKPLNC